MDNFKKYGLVGLGLAAVGTAVYFAVSEMLGDDVTEELMGEIDLTEEGEEVNNE